jgi:hypothetical protein
MARRSLRPHLNQIRSWVRQGRTDAWVAHQLEVTVQEIEQFKRQNDLLAEDAPADGSNNALAFPEEIDLRAEDDELIAAELEAAAEQARARAQAREESEPSEADEGGSVRRRRRPRRGRRPGSRASGPLEGTFDHGEEGYGLWLDPAIQENPIYAEHWAGHRPVQVTVEEDQIVIRRASEEDD